MNNKNKKTLQVVSLAVVGALLSAGIGGAVGHYVFPQKIDVPVPGPKVDASEAQLKEAFDNGVASVEPQTVTVKEIETVTVVDESFKQLACDKLLFEDVAECVEEVEAEDKALKLAVLEITQNFAEELKDADLVADRKRVEIVKVYEDYEDVEVLESNFDKDEYEFQIKVKVDDDKADEKFSVYFTVKVEDGKPEVKDVELVE